MDATRLYPTYTGPALFEFFLNIFQCFSGLFREVYGNEGADHLIDETTQGYFPENHEANYKFRGTKADIWEAGHRVPFLVQWPGNANSGQVVNNTICTTDFLATFADLINVKLADNEGEDSFSFLPLVYGEIGSYSRAPVINHSSAGMFAIRNAEYKLVLGNGSGGRQIPKGKAWQKPYALFNLEQDISETKNIIEENQAMAEEMENQLKKIMDSGNSRAMMMQGN